jgi:two-component system cell cycle response regulator DivK
MAVELVLIVEDNPKNMKLARDVLQYHGFRTLEAANATDGIHMAGEHHPDVVLMDIQLPDMPGDEALKALRAAEDTASLPVIAMTAFAMREERERLLSAGFDGYLSKPIDVKRFPMQVRELAELACAARGRRC